MAPNCTKDARDRRVLRRSRLGCRNCKLRKLKCDEHKPHCRRCISSKILCNFVPNTPDLQSAADDLGRAALLREKLKPQRPLPNAVWTSDGSTSYLLNTKCQDFVTRYLGRSLIDPSDPKMREVNRQLLGLAFANPFLMHASIAVAFAYDRYLNGTQDLRRTLDESHHCTRSITLFNKQLKGPIDTKKKDAIWGTAAALVILAFTIPDARTPQESWPLRPWDPTDLEWLRMSTGKMSLWEVANPLRPDSLFRIMAPTFAQMSSPLPKKGTTGIATALAVACRLEETSTTENNPYFEAAHAISRLEELSGRHATIGHIQLFMSSIHGLFESLLRGKDPVALLLLFLWYRKARQSVWWIELRARMECPSIYLYLRRYYKDYAFIHVLLSGDEL